MLLVDGSTTPGVSFWCETMPVLPNTDYLFTIWSTLGYTPLPTIQLAINGTPIGTFAPTATAGVWTRYQYLWNSGVAITANICMEDLNLTSFGNDFAVDDISFQQICVAKDSVFIDVSVPIPLLPQGILPCVLLLLL